MRYAVADPVNLATGRSIKIRDLVFLILKLAGHKPSKVIFDTSRPAGQKLRRVSTKKAKEKPGFTAQITLEEGLKETIIWYKRHREAKLAG